MATSAVFALCFENLTAVLIFAVTFLTVLYWSKGHRRRPDGLKLPPGPMTVPIIGNTHTFLRKDLLGALRGLRHKYGDIYSAYCGQELMVVLNGYDCIHEALVKKGGLFAMRPLRRKNSRAAVLFANGPVWKQNRSFLQRALWECGIGGAGVAFEDRANQQVDMLVDVLDNAEGSLDIRTPLTASIYNIISGMAFGKTYEYGDSSLKQTLDYRDTGALLLGSLVLPFKRTIKNIPWTIFKIMKVERMAVFLSKVFSRMLDKRIETFDATNTNTFADLFIQTTRQQKETQQDKIFNEVTFIYLYTELVGAATDTTESTILWLILFLLKYPEVQKQLHKDIDDVLGRERRPSLADRSRLPYVEASIMETMRIIPVLPFALPHSVPKDVIFQGHLIPENNFVLINLESVLKDPDVWSDPDEFRPERFLGDDGSVRAPKEFIPFSLGRRSCPGESMARMELFLYTTRLLQKFEFRLPDGDPKPDFQGKLSITYSPKAFRVCIEKR